MTACSFLLGDIPALFRYFTIADIKEQSGKTNNCKMLYECEKCYIYLCRYENIY